MIALLQPVFPVHKHAKPQALEQGRLQCILFVRPTVFDCAFDDHLAVLDDVEVRSPGASGVLKTFCLDGDLHA